MLSGSWNQWGIYVHLPRLSLALFLLWVVPWSFRQLGYLGEALLKTHFVVKAPRSHLFLQNCRKLWWLREAGGLKTFPQGSLRLREMHWVFSSWHVLCLLDWKGCLVLKAWWTQTYFEIEVRKKWVLRKPLVWDSTGYGLFGLKWSEFCRVLLPGHSFIEDILSQPSSHFTGRETYC